MVLAALEIDTDFNVNVLTGSDGVLRGAPGGHPDTAAGSKCCIIVTPLIRGRMATVCEKVVTVTTPGDCVDVLVTDYGIAVNPRRPDLIECLDKAGIPADWNFHATGTHQWGYWTDDMYQSWPTLAAGLGIGKEVAPADTQGA